jgi:hypothetical protein
MYITYSRICNLINSYFYLIEVAEAKPPKAKPPKNILFDPLGLKGNSLFNKIAKNTQQEKDVDDEEEKEKEETHKVTPLTPESAVKVVDKKITTTKPINSTVVENFKKPTLSPSTSVSASATATKKEEIVDLFAETKSPTNDFINAQKVNTLILDVF